MVQNFCILMLRNEKSIDKVKVIGGHTSQRSKTNLYQADFVLVR